MTSIWWLIVQFVNAFGVTPSKAQHSTEVLAANETYGSNP